MKRALVCGAGGFIGGHPSTALRPLAKRRSGQGSGHRFSKARIQSLGWEARVSLREGIERTYAWIEQQVKAMREKG